MRVRILSRKNTRLDSNKQNILSLYIEDYKVISSVKDARKLTEDIFLKSNQFIKKFKYKGYGVTWMWFNEIFLLSLKYLEIQELIRKLLELKPREIYFDGVDLVYVKIIKMHFDNIRFHGDQKEKASIKIINFIFNSSMFVYSLISIVLYYLNSKKYVGTYTGDYIYKSTKSDFRLSKLYEEYEQNKINFIEFIRPTSIKNFYKNIFIRRRLAVYFTSIEYFLNFFVKKSKKRVFIDFQSSILNSLEKSNNVLILQTKFMEKILRILKIKNFVVISSSSRSAPIMLACKGAQINTIGIMHGLPQRDYAVYEFIESYSDNKKIGCDAYGVWSEHYKKYFQNYSKILSKENIFVSGLLRPVDKLKLKTFHTITKNKIKILIIVEPLVDQSEIVPYLKKIFFNENFFIGFKLRPMSSGFDKNMTEIENQIPQAKACKKHFGRIESAANNYDILIGSHSTAVIEASLFNKLSLLVKTNKWGDYFDLNTLVPNSGLFIESPEDICKAIISRIDNEKKLKTIDTIREHFFGENNNGAKWVVNQIR